MNAAPVDFVGRDVLGRHVVQFTLSDEDLDRLWLWDAMSAELEDTDSEPDDPGEEDWRWPALADGVDPDQL